MAILEMVATLPIARRMEQLSMVEILLSVRVRRMKEMTKNPPVDGMHGQTIIVGSRILRLFAMHASNGATLPPVAICL